MTEATIIALVGSVMVAIPPTLVALAALRQSRQNGEKTESVIKKTDEIHTLTNSNLAKITTALAVATTKIEGMEKLIASLEKDKKP